MDPVVLNFTIREGANVDGEYETFIEELRETLANHPERENYIIRYGDWLIEHPLLTVQRPIQPARWIHINLILQDEVGVEETRITIAVRDDNVYLMGFKNRHDRWYELGFEGPSQPFILGSTFLGCDVGYRALVGGSANLVSLNLAKYDVIRAIRSLSGYQAVGPADGETKHHLARLCVIICECARMIPHRDKVIFHWNSNDNQSRITPTQAENIKDWSKMSRELLSDRHSHVEVVYLLLNTRESIFQRRDQQGQAAGGGGGSSQQGSGSSKTQMQSSGRPTSSSGGKGDQAQTGGGKSIKTKRLVGVYSVEAMGDIGSIVVFDGKRGQMIYKNRARPYRSVFSFIRDVWKSSIGTLFGSQRTKPLPLTGPYKAISADGCFAIQVRDITDASGESSNVIGEMLWDCYDKNVEYDKVLERVIISTGTGLHLARVSYAAFSDAVEATVEVNLLLPAGNTSVYGGIMAVYPELHINGVMLFERGRDEKLELAPSAAGSMVPLELARSVLAVPFSGRYSRVGIYVDLTVVHPNEEERDVSLTGYVTLYLDKHTGEIRVDPYSGDITVPGGWWWRAGIPDATGGDGASGSGSGQGTGQTTVQQCKVQLNITSPGFHVSPLQPESLGHMGLNL